MIRSDTQPGRFDFGLTSSQEERAARLHRQSIVFDTLSQHAGGNIFSHYPPALQAEFRANIAAASTPAAALAQAIYWPFEVAWRGESDLIRQWFSSAGLTCGTYDIDILFEGGRDPLSCDWDAPLRRYTELPWLRLATTAAQIRRAKEDGAIALYANCQPVTPVNRDLSAFDVAYEKGLRSFMLTYNRMDNVGVGCTERVDAGLSMFGVEVVHHCNELGMIVDVSHCGHLTTIDACRYARKPVTANHTCARSVFNHARGKADDALRAIAGTGGVIGVVAVPFFLSDGVPTIEHMLDHLEYIVNLIGWQHVAIGTDWPLQAPDDVLRSVLEPEVAKVGFRSQDRIDVAKRLIGFDDCRDLPNITRGLVKRGYNDEQIRGILGENALRVFEAVCG